MAATPEQPLRKDAERNRQRVVSAARELFAARGLDVTFEDIARAADVGVGTVYRRYPDKEKLIDALFEERLEVLRQAAHAALAVADPWTALVGFIETTLEMLAEDRGLKELLHGTGRGQANLERARQEILPITARLLERAQASGAIRTDVTVPDLQLAQYALSELATATHDVDPEVWRRILVILLDGLRPDRRRPSPMPTPSLDQHGLTTVMGQLQRRHPRSVRRDEADAG
jgi:AcrR family transcriptional regulator